MFITLYSLYSQKLTAATQAPLDVYCYVVNIFAFAYCQLSKFVVLYQGVAHLQAAERVLTELLIVALEMRPRTS